MPGWKCIRLGDIARTTSGGTPRRDRPHFYGGKISWVKSGELGDGVVYETEESLTQEGLESSNAKVFPKGTLCIALYGATVGKLGILGIDAATNQAICAIFPPPELDTRYLFRFFESKRRELVEQGKGGAQSNISQGIIRDSLVPHPGITEQRRIVAEIEKQFTRLEAGVTALRRVQANLKRYRAAVLKAACEGKLVPTEAELVGRVPPRGAGVRENGGFEPPVRLSKNLESGEQLLQRILAERRKKWNGKGKYNEPASPDTRNLPGVPEGWVWATLGALVREPLRNGHSAKATGNSTGLRVFTLSAVTEGDFSERNTKLSVATPDKVKDLWAEPGDIYVERSNTPELVGICRLYKGERRFAFIPDLFIRVRVQKFVYDRYIEICLLSERGRNFLRSRAQGISGTMPKIDQETVELAPIPLPPLAEQKRIVAEVERRLSVVEELEALVSANLQRAIRLRQSILQKAFTGELV